MAKSRKAGSEEFRNKLEERKGTDWYNSAARKGDLYDPRVDDNRGKLMYSGAEVRAEMRDGRGDMSTEEMTKYYEDAYASGDLNLNGNAKDYLRENFGAKLERREVSTPERKPAPTASTGTAGGNQAINSPISNANPIDIDGNSNQVSQDNSITQTVDNSTDNSDNSQRYYGGSSRTFNYKGGDGESKLYDTPVSSATMAGFYDVDDSPGASQKFMDQYIDSNRLAQRSNRNEYNKYKNVDYSSNDPARQAELNSELKSSIQESRDRSNTKRDNIFQGRNPFDINFTLPGMPSAIESNAGQIYEDTLKKIK